LPVTLVNCFQVPAGRDEEFFRIFQEVNTYMRAQPGYLGHKLHRALGREASFSFVNVVLWESVEHFRASHGDEFRRMISRQEWAPFTSKPGLYEVVHEGAAPGAAK
jgi:heme-degrading monooxygenase HmoA